MSKQVKDLLRQDIVKRLGEARELAVVSVIGVDGVTNNRLRRDLLEKGIHVMVVKNAMARQAFSEVGLGDAAALLDGACALAFGGESVVNLVRELLGRTKDVPQLVVKGAFMEGEAFGPERVEELSKYPTRIEALGRVVSAAKAPGARLVGALTGPGGILASILKTLEERAGGEEAGETAAPAAE